MVTNNREIHFAENKAYNKVRMFKKKCFNCGEEHAQTRKLCKRCSVLLDEYNNRKLLKFKK